MRKLPKQRCKVSYTRGMNEHMAPGTKVGLCRLQFLGRKGSARLANPWIPNRRPLKGNVCVFGLCQPSES